MPPDGTTSHLTKAASCQVIGYRNDVGVWHHVSVQCNDGG